MKLNYQNLSSILKNYKTSQNSFISKEFLVPLEQENQINYKNIDLKFTRISPQSPAYT